MDEVRGARGEFEAAFLEQRDRSSDAAEQVSRLQEQLSQAQVNLKDAL